MPDAKRLGLHVVRDQPRGAFGDRPLPAPASAAATWSDGSIALPTSCKKRRQQKLLVVRPLLARQLEDLQAVIERVPLRMILGALLDPFQRLEQHPEEQVRVDLVFDPLDLGFEVDVGIFLAQEALPARRSRPARSPCP